MKRPSGFDRGPARPDPNAQGAGASDHDEATDAEDAGENAGGAAAARLIGRLRSRTAKDAAAEAGADGLAPTVDLSAVRRARDASDAEELDLISGETAEVERSEPNAVGRWRAARAADPVRAAEQRVRVAERQRKALIRRERKRFTLASRRRRRTWWIVWSAIGALVIFVGVGAFTPLMAVREVQLVGAKTVDADAVSEALARFEGVPLALVDDADVHRALEPFPLIQRYAVERTPPHTMTVRIEERIPVISLPGEGGIAQYDAAGVLLGATDAAPEGVPLGSGAVEDRSSAAFLSAARALRDMPPELRAQVVGVTASSAQDVTFVLSSGVEVLWGDAEQTRRKALVLSSILSSLADRPIEQVDVSSSEAPVFR